MDQAVKLIGEKQIVPVIKLDEAAAAVPLARALTDGGLPVAEITFRTKAAAESIRRIREAYPDLICGAGTVVTLAQAREAKEAGAMFLVCPGFSQEIVAYAQEQGLPVFPGCCTPTDLVKAVACGPPDCEIFPGEAVRRAGHNPGAFGAVSGPFLHADRGIHAENLREYLLNDRIYACGGSWMASDSLIREGRFAEIEERTREAVRLAGQVQAERKARRKEAVS